jgi:DNA-binding NarL/FixJ family response regulator
LSLTGSGFYALTLVDYRLGQENGLDVIREAKSRCPNQIVYLYTAMHSSVTRDQAEQAGADGYIDKVELSTKELRDLLLPYLEKD